MAQFRGTFGRRLLLFVIYLVVVCSLTIIATITLIRTSNQRDGELFEPKLVSAEEPSKRILEDPLFEDKILSVDRSECNSSTIHIGLVCGGYNSTRNFYVLLKSILFYRTNPIHLHLMVDNISQTILAELFNTWLVPDLRIDYYNVSSYEHEVAWITSQHYSHRFGLMKLIFLSVLAERVGLKKVILMDTDMLTLGNINHLWKELNQMNANKGSGIVFGMVENQSDWYLGNSQLSAGRIVWPALGRGFNSGLMLVDLVELIAINWNTTWRQVAELELTSHLTTSLADQDIFNAVIRLNGQIIYVLPCTYNLQLNDHTQLDELCPDHARIGDFQLVHWNSPHKLLSKNALAERYKNWYITFRNWDGMLLEQQSCCCSRMTRNKSNSWAKFSNDSTIEFVCSEIRPGPFEKLRTYLYFLEFELNNNSNAEEVTFVVHLSLDRLQVLDQLAAHWPGPISAAIYLSELETNLLLASVENSNNLVQRRNIGYHLVYRDQGFNYPINRLRNIALENAISPFIFQSDIDFLPSLNLYEYLKRTISNLAAEAEPTGSDPLEKRALVVPAFENLQYKFEFPTSKAELITQLNLGSVSMFRDQLWPRGHSPTNYPKWRAATKPYKIDWRLDYEPFIVASKLNLPKFDQRFVGFGWNKVEHIMQLAALDYEFLVLPEAFVIHKFHSASYDILKHRQSSRYRSCINRLRKSFLVELKTKFPGFFDKNSPANQSVGIG